MKVTDLVSYPIKSGKGIALVEARVGTRGLEMDRQWAIVDKSGQALTGREDSKILQIETTFSGDDLQLNIPNQSSISLNIPRGETSKINLRIFSNEVEGLLADLKVHEALSAFLGQEVRLAFMDYSYHRQVKEKHKGKPGDEIAYADAAPILLVSRKSIEELNDRLENKVSWLNFRPNIVIDGELPYEEDQWSSVRIGEVEFNGANTCARCGFITIDPKTGIKNSQGEPLKTLATYRNFKDKGICFGKYLIPKTLGKIKVGETVEIK